MNLFKTFNINLLEKFLGIVSIILTSCFLVIKILYGLDFTDEMQYYGQLKSLLENNKLYANDYFFQQNIYLLFYPIFEFLFQENTDYSNLIFISRIILTIFILISILIFYIATKKFNFTSRIIASCFIPIACTEYLPYAISYNTISFLLVTILFTLILISNFRYKIHYIPILIIFTTWSYPQLGILVSLFYILEIYFSKNLKELKFFIFNIVFLSILFSTALIYFDYITISDIKKSILFTSFFSIDYQEFNLLFYIFGIAIILIYIFIILIFSLNKFFIIKKFFKSNKFFLILFFINFFFAIIFNYIDVLWRYSVICFFSSIVILILLKEEIKISDRIKISKIIFLAILLSFLMTFTSNNFFVIFYRGFFILLPFLFLYLVKINSEKKITLINLMGLIILLSLTINILSHPYRDQNFLNKFSTIKNIPIFKNTYISLEKKSLIEEVQKKIIVEKNKDLLIIGPNPWIYFVLKSEINSPNIYMHFGVNKKKTRDYENFLLENINKPDYILISSRNFSKYLKENLNQELMKYSCNDINIDKNLITKVTNQTGALMNENMTLCKRKI
jgi:hypothetical protein